MLSARYTHALGGLCVLRLTLRREFTKCSDNDNSHNRNLFQLGETACNKENIQWFVERP